MKQELKKAAVEFFNACTPKEKADSFAYMVTLVSAREKTMVFYAPYDDIQTGDLLRLFDVCTFEEKIKTFSTVIELWVERNRDLKEKNLLEWEMINKEIAPKQRDDIHFRMVKVKAKLDAERVKPTSVSQAKTKKPLPVKRATVTA